MANSQINYAKKINKLLSELPDFVSDFIYNLGSAQNYATKYEYSMDIYDFLRYMINYMPEHAESLIKDLTLSDLDRVDPITINRYLMILAGDGENGCKLSTIKRRRASLSSMYAFFLVNNQVSSNPVLATKAVRLPEKKVIYLTNQEQAVLLEAVRTGDNLGEKAEKRHNLYADRDSALFLLMLDTGLRVSEIVGTDISDYNFEDCCVVVIRKGGDIDTVFYSDECKDFLKIYFDEQRRKYQLPDKKIPAFTTATGVRLGVRAVETLVKKYMAACMPEKAGIISPHKLRSSFAMSFYEASAGNILLLQKRMHHKSISTTNIYAKASDSEVRNSRGYLQELREKRKKN